MAFFTIICQKMAKKSEEKKKIVFELNYKPENVKEMQKTVFIRVG